MRLPDHYIESARRGGVWIERNRCFIGKLNPHIKNLRQSGFSAKAGRPLIDRVDAAVGTT
jgi:hypothetical protein